MRVFSLNTVALALVLLSLTVPTGAVLGDHVGGTEGIVLSPHDGPNGKYASYDGDGNLSIDLGDDLNADAETTFEGVFEVTNNASHYAQVWITHNATRYVEFRGSGAGSIQGAENATVLAPGETLVVSLTVETSGTAPGEQLIQKMRVHARHVDPPTTDSSSSSAGGSGGSGGSGQSTAPTGTPQEPTGTLVSSGEVRIRFDGDVRSDEEVRIERLGGLPADPVGASLTARATRMDGGGVTSNDTPASEERLRALGLDTAVRPGEPFVVTGSTSLFPSTASIAPDGRVAAVFDVTPPPRLRDSPATIWIRLNRSHLGGSDPSEARLVRGTEDGWQVLGTRAVAVNATHVELRSETPGFSPFAVFPRTSASFDWTFERRGTATGVDVPLTYDEPGVYRGTLVVTDARGRTDEATYRVLVNDNPRIRIERPETVEPGRPVTLRAAVDDEFGDTRVEWEFEDGTVARGESVTRAFDRGEHTVTVRAVDEYGATGLAETTIVAGSRDPLVQVVEFTLGVEGRLALVALVSLAVVGALRWLNGRRDSRRRRPTR